jgi:ATP-dependent helicase HrpB
VLVLHSVVPQEEQEAAMLPALPGYCKVILATNIAESSITIPDVRIVINTGLHRCPPHQPSIHCCHRVLCSGLCGRAANMKW